MAVYEIPEAALDAAEVAWNLRIENGIITPPREHIAALLRAAAPYMAVIPGEVIPNAPEQQTLDLLNSDVVEPDGTLTS